ncbi:MAG: acyl-CoA dehydrogenase family protein [Actinomycetota bacterium]
MIDFSLSAEQQQIIETTRDFGKRQLEAAEIAVDRMPDPDAAFQSDEYRETMAAAFQLGFHKMGIAEQYGGLGLDSTTTGPVWEELARYGVGFAAALMAGSVVPAIIAFLAPGNKRLVERYIEPFCADTTGTRLTAWGSSEPAIGSDGKNYGDLSIHHKTTATKTPDGYLLNGAKSAFVSNGGIAEAMVVFACIESDRGLRGSGMFVLDTAAEGVTRGAAEDRVGLRALNQASVSLDDVLVPDDQLLFPPSDAYPMLHHAMMTVGNLGTGYLAVGLMRAAYEEALGYAKERVQWGQPIVKHQLVAKKLFDMQAAIESCRALLWKGSWHSAHNFPGDLRTSLTAKILTTNLAVKHTAEMVQVLGGYGITRDYKLEKYMRDASLLTIMDGTNDTLMMEVMSQV